MIHRYWTGPATPPAEPWLAEVLQHLHPHHRLHDWTDDTLPADVVHLLDTDPAGADPRHRANVVRWALLAEHGGIWLDHDIIPLRPLPAGAWTATLGAERSACAVALPAGHHLAHLMSTAIAMGARTGSVVDISGDRLLNRVAPRAGTLTPLGSHRLPFDAVGRPVAGAEPWAVHLWSTSSTHRLTRAA